MEKQCFADIHALSWHCLRPLLHLELGSLVRKLLSCHTILHSGCSPRFMVWSLGPPHICRSIFWIPQTCNWATRQNQSNSPANSGSVSLYSTHSRHHHGRSSPLWMHLHSTLLHSQQHLVKPDLLHVRISFPCLCDSDHHMLGNNNFALLLSFVCWGTYHYNDTVHSPSENLY